MTLSGTIQGIWRHPIKGFTPEALTRVTLDPAQGLAFDRAWAVENGPSGFDPLHPLHISKFRFVALAPTPRAAAIRTALDDTTGRLSATLPGLPDITVDLTDPSDCRLFEVWLTAALADDAEGPLKVVQAPAHRFLDDPAGQVSLTNRASLQALGARMGLVLDPRRLRGNIDIVGWPAFAEVELPPGTVLRLGDVTVRVVKPIQRCIATHVNPDTALRDADFVSALMSLTGHAHCGVYVQVIQGGDVANGQAAGTVA
jgi:uncharacterized protein